MDPPDASDPYILVWTNVHIAEQTATCDPIPKAGAGDPVEDWIDFLTSHPGLDTTDPAPVDFPGGQDEKGQTIDVSVAADWTTVCPTHTGPYVMLIANNDGIEYGVPSDQRLQLTLLEVRGQTVVIEVYGPKSPELLCIGGGGHTASDRLVQVRVRPIRPASLRRALRRRSAGAS